MFLHDVIADTQTLRIHSCCCAPHYVCSDSLQRHLKSIFSSVANVKIFKFITSTCASYFMSTNESYVKAKIMCWKHCPLCQSVAMSRRRGDHTDSHDAWQYLTVCVCVCEKTGKKYWIYISNYFHNPHIFFGLWTNEADHFLGIYNIEPIRILTHAMIILLRQRRTWCRWISANGQRACVTMFCGMWRPYANCENISDIVNSSFPNLLQGKNGCEKWGARTASSMCTRNEIAGI